jgi:hypothetical protein
MDPEQQQPHGAGHQAGTLVSDMDLVLGFIDDEARAAAFQSFSEKLQASSAGLDLDALRACIRLLPRSNQVSL